MTEHVTSENPMPFHYVLFARVSVVYMLFLTGMIWLALSTIIKPIFTFAYLPEFDLIRSLLFLFHAVLFFNATVAWIMTESNSTALFPVALILGIILLHAIDYRILLILRNLADSLSR